MEQDLFGDLPPDVPRPPPAHLGLFERASTTSEQSAVQEVVQRVASWPKNVPGLDDALRCLTAQEDANLGPLAAPTARVQPLLTQEQRAALADANAGHELMLRKSALLLWRIIVARSTAPSLDDIKINPDRVDLNELKSILSQADDLLTRLAAEGEHAEARLAARRALAGEAVELTGFADRVESAVEVGLRNRSRTKGRARWVPNVRLPGSGVAPRGAPVAWLVLIAVLGGGAYYHLHGETRVLPTAPFGKVINASQDGTKMIIEDLGLQPIELDKLKRNMWKQGKVVVNLGRGRYMVAPLPEKAPKDYPYEEK